MVRHSRASAPAQVPATSQPQSTTRYSREAPSTFRDPQDQFTSPWPLLENFHRETQNPYQPHCVFSQLAPSSTECQVVTKADENMGQHETEVSVVWHPLHQDSTPIHTPVMGSQPVLVLVLRLEPRQHLLLVLSGTRTPELFSAPARGLEVWTGQ